MRGAFTSCLHSLLVFLGTSLFPLFSLLRLSFNLLILRSASLLLPPSKSYLPTLHLNSSSYSNSISELFSSHIISISFDSGFIDLLGMKGAAPLSNNALYPVVGYYYYHPTLLSGCNYKLLIMGSYFIYLFNRLLFYY